MGNVCISFGSPTSGQGFDVATTVSQIVANLQAVETPWQNQLTSLHSQDTALTGIGTDLSALSSAVSALDEVDGTFTGMEGSSSDNSVVELTSAGLGAVAGSYTVVVSQLAQTFSYTSAAIGAGDSLSGSLTIGGQQIQISDGTATDSSGNIIPQNNTLSTLAASINAGDYGVSATVVSGASGSQLALMSQTSGAGGAVTIDGSALADTTAATTGTAFSQAQKGQDAGLSVDGVSTTSASNTVTTAIPGVTMQLLSAAPSESVQVEITTNNSQVESAVSTFVSAYNTVVGDLNTQEGSDTSGNSEPLFGNPDLAMLQEQLQGALTFAQSSGAITSLGQLGITPNNDGTLSLNAATLDSALNGNYQGVVNFFQGAGSFGANMVSALTNLGNSGPDGVLYLALQQNSSEETQLNTNITNEQTHISAQQTQLTTELNQANYTLQEIPSQIDEVNELYSAITGYNQNANS
ncbi:MAG TPA: flagellar filament capping protein FliD [Acidobacteriaceae bacterium]|jgi:flagellar hook-associated protein 2|nr:flagellar filament capping protein FliD [Acidobacteriaceae bacterium]